MKQHINQVKSARIHAENPDVQHVGNPGHRMPVCSMAGGKGPIDAGQGNTVFNMVILEKIDIIII